MKVLLCSPYEPVIKENAGGIAMWAKHIMDYYSKNNSGVSIEVLPYNRSIYVHDGLNAFVRIYKGAKDYLGLIGLTRRRIKEEHFDVLHLCSSALMSIIRDYWVMRMARCNGIAGVLHFHCGRIPRIAASGGWRWNVLKRAVAMANAVVVLDDESFNVLVSHGFKHVYKIPNPLSTEMLLKIETMRPNIQRVPRRLLFVGHVIPSKGVYELVQACSAIPDVELRLIGRVEEKVKCELQQIASVKPVEWMHLLGECGHDDVLREMLECDLFLFPSYTEGFPNVILEAMACRVPIISTGVGAIPEMLECENGEKAGILIPVRDAEALRDAVCGLIDNSQLKSELVHRAYDKVKSVFSISVVWKKLVETWNNASTV
ncbi:MAG: glycosyltransferase family 4 protein [Bacteroidaceae bacterium]|nr:glycosyltransferase family 4 protein [Bacteroidaceae bacterium]